MCVYSMIADDWNRRNGQWVEPLITPTITPDPSYFRFVTPESPATKKDIDDLRAELQELKKLLKAAAAYDAASGQPECEQEEKIALIRKMAEITGVDMEDCLPKKAEPVLLTEVTINPTITGTVGQATTAATLGDTAWSNSVSWTTEPIKKPWQPWSTRDDGSHP